MLAILQNKVQFNLGSMVLHYIFEENFDSSTVAMWLCNTIPTTYHDCQRQIA